MSVPKDSPSRNATRRRDRCSRGYTSTRNRSRRAPATRRVAARDWLVGATLLVVGMLSTSASAVEQVAFQRDNQQHHLAGKLLVTASDGGLLLLAPDGVLWTVQPDELTEQTTTPVPFSPLDREALARTLLASLPDGFEVAHTAHYLICYNTSKAYANWCGGLYERLYRAKTNFWRRKGFELQEPEIPLVALVFADRDSYRAYAKAELGQAVDNIVGYYSLRTNRIAMYDLTGVESLRQPGDRRGNLRQINAMLSRPQAAPMVATIVHEATHQIAFNTGLHTRYADIPLWVSEGLAIYFETPDLSSSRGWRGIGAVNHSRLATFQRNRATRRPGALTGLIANDQAMRNVRTGPDAYAEAWALTYYLLRRQPQAYLDYLQMLSVKRPLVWDVEAERIREFEAYFGPIEQVEADMLRAVGRLR